MVLYKRYADRPFSFHWQTSCFSRAGLLFLSLKKSVEGHFTLRQGVFARDERKDISVNL